MIISTNGEEATLALGMRIASLLSFGQTLLLCGELGAGKTVISRGIARGLGITEPVTSPTFTVVQEYRLPKGNMFYHLDMYRIDGEEAALAFGIEDFLFAPNAITLVEWPERIPGLLPVPPALKLAFQHCDYDFRKITIPDELGARLLELGLPEGCSISS
ncbi:MAG: tRNA (adenosine(37)-N6)-threonylcarbamoyltransferase complex ATPase subunit type 1 TsaE [Victivallales bacterium]|nr:tRNA (adenosine(37)-N6)-threonylcarbamoyltransferase complex ATPase subunit type 1 TsaE [Victivallales bacterium]